MADIRFGDGKGPSDDAKMVTTVDAISYSLASMPVAITCTKISPEINRLAVIKNCPWVANNDNAIPLVYKAEEGVADTPVKISVPLGK